jgi:hypothetical protein
MGMLTAESIMQHLQEQGVQYDAPVLPNVHKHSENIKPDFSYSPQSYHTFFAPSPLSPDEAPLIIKRKR